MPENDFLDAEVAQPAEHPKVPEVLGKLCSYAVITVLDAHPNKTSMAPSLVVKNEDSDAYLLQVDLGELDSLEAVMDGARQQLARQPKVEAYALLVDSTDLLPGFPERRPLDESGNPYPEGTPTMAMYLGTRDVPEGFLVMQPYRRRRIRGGATPMGAPLIAHGPDSLLNMR